jgi:N4-gp56 family major capsid protein
MTTQDPLLAETAELLGENAGETLDAIYRDSLVAGTTVQYSGTATARTAVTAQVTTADLDKITRTLSVNNAKFWNMNPIVGQDRHNTTPVSPAYFCIVHPRTSYDLRNLTGFTQTHKYPSPDMAVPGEIGSYNQLRFIESTQAKTWADSGGSATDVYYTTSATKVDVFAMLVFGRDAYGITPLGGKALENLVKPLGAGDDPLNQRATSGWKATTDLVILNDDFMLRYEHAVSL